MFDQDLQAEVIKITEPEGPVDDTSDSATNSFHEALGDAVIEVVEELLPPVAQSIGESCQVATARCAGLPYPSSKESYRLGSVGDLITNGAKLLFEAVDSPQFGRCFPDHLQLFFLLSLQLAALLEQGPLTALQGLSQRAFRARFPEAHSARVG